jgi:hypothetical protein
MEVAIAKVGALAFPFLGAGAASYYSKSVHSMRSVLFLDPGLAYSWNLFPRHKLITSSIKLDSALEK